MIGSLFSGYGGLDMAAQAAFGLPAAFVADIEPGPCKILAHHHPTDAIGYAAELRALKGAAMDGRMSPADAQRYAGGGLRITPGQPFRPAGELDQPQYDIRPMLTSAKEAI